MKSWVNRTQAEDAERKLLIQRYYDADTEEKLLATQRDTHAWLKRFPDDTGMDDMAGSLAMFLDKDD